MAQIFWTASDYALDANTTDAWENRFNITSQLVKSDVDGKYMEVLHASKTSGGMEFLPPANFSDGEVLALLKGPATSFDNAVIIRSDFFNSTGSRNFYAFDILGANLRITKYVSGTRTVIQQVANPVSVTSLFWVRVQATGTTIRGRIWADGSAEPSTWNVEVTDNAIPGPGFAGFAVYDQTIQSYQYSVGTGADPAPSGPVGSTPTITNIDTDNAVNQYQQNAVVSLSNFTETITSVTLNAVACPIQSQVVGTSVTVDIPGSLATGTYDLVVSGATETATLTGVSYTQTHARPAFDGLVDSNSILSGQSYTPNTYFTWVTVPPDGTLDIAAGDARQWQDDIADYFTPTAGFTDDTLGGIQFLYSDGTTSATVGVTISVVDGVVVSVEIGRRGVRPAVRAAVRSAVTASVH